MTRAAAPQRHHRQNESAAHFQAFVAADARLPLTRGPRLTAL
jgi:hypothetical protein